MGNAAVQPAEEAERQLGKKQREAQQVREAAMGIGQDGM